MHAMHNNVNLSACGYGSKTLRITAMMLEKAIVWPGKSCLVYVDTMIHMLTFFFPVTHVMAKALETQAAHMDQRAEVSIKP
jgi:hypothetical protein